MFKLSLGSFGAFPSFGTLYLEKQLSQSKMDHNLGLRGKFKVSLGSFLAFLVFDDFVSTFDLNIQGPLFCQIYMLLVFF